MEEKPRAFKNKKISAQFRENQLTKKNVKTVKEFTKPIKFIF